MRIILICSLVLIKVIAIVKANEFYIDDHQIPNEFFKNLKTCKTPDERLGKLNGYITDYIDNRTKQYEDLPFIYRKIYGSNKPTFHHDEIIRNKKINWDPQHLLEIEKLPFLKRVWARTKHPENCGKCNGLDEYKRQIDEKMVEKIRNITQTEEQLRHGANHEHCHSHGNCDSHGDMEAVVYEDVTSSEEKKREEAIKREQKRQEAIEKLNYHFYRRALMESKLTGESPEKIFKQYHRMNPEQLQQRFHAVYQKYIEMRKKMQAYYAAKQRAADAAVAAAGPAVPPKQPQTEPPKEAGLGEHIEEYKKFLKNFEESRRKKEEEIKRKIEEKRKEEMRVHQQKHKDVYEKYLVEQRKLKEQKDKENEYKRREIESIDKQLNEIAILKENIKKEIERTKNEGDIKDLESLEKLEQELLQWEQKVLDDKHFKLQNLDLITDKINQLRDKLLNDLKNDVVHGQHKNEQSFEMAKKRYLHVKENFNKQVNMVRDKLVKPEDEEEYDSKVYDSKDHESEEEEGYNTHEEQLLEIDEVKQHLTDELEKAKKEGKNIRDIYQLEGARKQIEDWEEKVKNDNALHYEKANIVNRKINEFKGFLNQYKVYKYSTTAKPEEEK